MSTNDQKDKPDHICNEETFIREDTSSMKRVELSCHTNMSKLDGTTDVWDLIERAQYWGHKSIAITDGGSVCSFPKASYYVKTSEADRSIKIIYGMEGYLIDTEQDDSSFRHVSILVKNEIGKENLYKIVSLSQLKYFNGRPLIPRNELIKYKEGLLIGSGCGKGELFQAVLSGATEEQLAEIIAFYDYLEVQPSENNLYQATNNSGIKDNAEEHIRSVNRRIVELGEKLHKPVVATGDVHYLDPEDEQYLRIIKWNQGATYADEMPPLYFHTTDEMLEEFSYLGEEKAKEIVIYNTNQIADMIEAISPINSDEHWPVISDAAKILWDNCAEKAHSIYGNELPPEVADRMEREFNIIVSNGWESIFVLWQKLVSFSTEAGYPVVSRGTVGSSLIAFLDGITQINPLSPHYICPKCHYADFESEDVRRYFGRTGFDMPDKICPYCGSKMKKDGFDIPMESFFGLNGDHGPDIDLAFSGEYQRKVQKYAGSLFGGNQVFFCGTTRTLSGASACTYVENYYKDHGMSLSDSEIDNVAMGCEGIQCGSGVHPNGLIIIPQGENICSFTPVQHPDNDPESDINIDTDKITTHFDYHFLEPGLIKMDIIGSDLPTVMKAMEDYINSTEMDNKFDSDHLFSMAEIPMDDPEVISLFRDTSALEVSSEDLFGVPTGCLGIFGYDSRYCMELMHEIQPYSLSDLIQATSVQHGTGVWNDYTVQLLQSGQVSFTELPCSRDDIMNYLFRMGMDQKDACNIMEIVRKGKVSYGNYPGWAEYVEKMKSVGVPDWFIDCCEQIKYMFTKAHSADYVVSAYRIAYCKLLYPLAFYGAYFSVISDALSYEKMIQDKGSLQKEIENYLNRQNQLSDEEQDELRDMIVLLEMHERGYIFVPVDPEKAESDRCLISDDNLMPPLNRIR